MGRMTVTEVLARYGITVERCPLAAVRTCADLTGPSNDVGVRWPATVVAAHDASPATVLHEGAHLICAAQIGDIDCTPEEDGLLQLERALARYLSEDDRYEVVSYQSGTALDMNVPEVHGRSAEVGDWKHPTRTWWWRAGRANAQRLGLLDDAGQPTWRRVQRKERTG